MRLEASLLPHTGGEIARLQRRSLRRLVGDVRRTSPHYRRTLSDVADDCDLSDLPFLTRQTLQDHPDEFISDDCNGSVCNRKLTSGTSGMPVTIIESEEENYSSLHYDLARTMRLALPQQHPRWRAPSIIAVGDNTRHSAFALKNPLVGKWCRFEVIDPLDESSQTDLVDLLSELQPAALVSTPSALRLVAAHADRFEKAYPLPIVSSGANLYPDDRNLLETAFGGPVTDLYALSECSGVASQCSAGSYHVHWELACVEVIDPETGAHSRPGEPGEIVVTDLERRAMPIIRYRTGDWGTPGGECPCGRSGPCLRSIDGRAGSYFRMSSGRLLNPSVLNPTFAARSEIRQARVTHVGDDRLLVEFVPRGPVPADFEADLLERLHRRLPVPANIEIRRVSELWKPGQKQERYVSAPQDGNN